MDAQSQGFGFVVPRPSFFASQLGNIVYIKEQGVLYTTGNMFEDAHFKNLAEQSAYTIDRTRCSEDHPFMTVAFTTGCVDVKPLTEEELSK
jgi:hypothetical protein